MEQWEEEWLADVVAKIKPIRERYRPENEGKSGQRTPDWIMETTEGLVAALEMTALDTKHPTEVDGYGNRVRREVWAQGIGPCDLTEPVKRKIKDKTEHGQLEVCKEKWLVIRLNLDADQGWLSIYLDIEPDDGIEEQAVEHEALREIAKCAREFGIDQIILVALPFQTNTWVVCIEAASCGSKIYKVEKGWQEWPPPSLRTARR